MRDVENESWETALTWAVLPAGRAWQRAAGAALARLGISLSAAALVLVIVRLGDGIRQKDVAEASAIDPAAIARSVTQLELDGLLLRRTDAVDARAKTLHLTAQGRELAAKLEDALQELRGVVVARMDPEDGMAAARILRELEEACVAFVSSQSPT
ncbi:MarR family transcriptional regulator [Stenotrophomonas rhizophila]|uniref:MarR family transcriptional regulator n=1 Tax=Stenotrophomonas rhizophila TaxID=216778 RepID=A0A498CMP0_9GAMM|nr:MarR family transcriptional regulator [Stenotrophomonas rhizophila]RLK56394.1 MarR family transcriptional regulator [Stenotrophomonas rhizophila]